MVQNYKEFSLSEYARVGRALALYEVGDREEAIAEMEDVSISLKGYPGIYTYMDLNIHYVWIGFWSSLLVWLFEQRCMQLWLQPCMRTNMHHFLRKTSSPLQLYWILTIQTSHMLKKPSIGHPAWSVLCSISSHFHRHFPSLYNDTPLLCVYICLKSC